MKVGILAGTLAENTWRVSTFCKLFPWTKDLAMAMEWKWNY